MNQIAEHLGKSFRFHDLPSRRRIAIKAALTQGGTMAVFTACGRFDLALVASLGLFAVLYAPDVPYRRRLWIVGGIAITFFLGALLGVATAHNQAMLLVTLTAMAPLAAFVCNALYVGPPGAYFVLLGCGVANYLVSARGLPPGEILAMTAIGGTVALSATMAELALDPSRPERRAVEHAAGVVIDYVGTSPGGDAAASHEKASEALHAAWTALGSAAPFFPRRRWAARRGARLRVLRGELRSAQRDFDRRLRVGSAAYFAPAPPSADGSEGEEFTTEDRDAGLADEMGASADAGRGRPPARVLLAQSAMWPSENLVTAFRVLVATALAGVVTFALGGEHIYWSTAFAALALHQGGPRVVQTYRGINRLVGTVLGIGLFVAIGLWHPGVWPLLAVIALLQFLIEIFVARQYAVASAFITPVALLISTGGHFPDSPWPLAGERLFDTVLGIGAALIATWALGRSLPLRLIRGHTLRTLDAAADFLDDPADPDRAERLYTQSRLLRGVAGSVAFDGGRAAGAALRSAREVEHIGFLLLGALGPHEDLLPDGSRERLRMSLLDMAGRMRGAHFRDGDHDLDGAVATLAQLVRAEQRR